VTKFEIKAAWGLDQILDFAETHKGWKLYEKNKPIDRNDVHRWSEGDDHSPMTVFAGRVHELANGERISLWLKTDRLNRTPRAFYAGLNVAFAAGPETDLTGGIDECSAWLGRWEKTLQLMDRIILSTDIAEAARLLHNEMPMDHGSTLTWALDLVNRPFDGLNDYTLLQVSKAFDKPPAKLAEFVEEWKGWRLGSKGPLRWYAGTRIDVGAEGYSLRVQPNWEDIASSDGWSLAGDISGVTGDGTNVTVKGRRDEVIAEATLTDNALRTIPRLRECGSVAEAAELAEGLRGERLDLVRRVLNIQRGSAKETRRRIVRMTCGARLDMNAFLGGNW
jgi:hypothetical protein